MITTNSKADRPDGTRPAVPEPHGSGPASTDPASRHPARSGLAGTGPDSVGPDSTGQPSTGQPSTGPASTEEALAAVTAGLRYLARADMPSLGAAGQARCLRVLEAAESVHTAARVNALAAFSSGAGYADDGCGSVRSWLVWQTQVTRGAAAGAQGWLRRLRGHRAIWEALAEGTISASWAR